MTRRSNKEARTTVSVGAQQPRDDLFRAIVEASPSAIVVVDAEGMVTLANSRTAELFGYSPAELLREAVEKLIPERYRDRHREYRRLFLQEPRARPMGAGRDLYCLRRDGSEVAVEIGLSSIKTTAGTFVLTSIIDISERKRAEEQLLVQRRALECAANEIVITDRSGKIVWVNRAFTMNTGYEPSEVIGQNPRLLKSGQQPDDFYREMWETILAGKTWHDVIINRKKDGSLVHEDMTITPIQNAAGEITHFIAIKQDISEQLRAQEALHETNEALQTFIRASPLAIVALDMERRVKLWNPAAEKLFGWTEAEAIGNALATIPEEDVPAQLELREQFLSRGETISDLETRSLRKDGLTVDVSVSFAPLRDPRGNISGTMGIIADITERKAAEQLRLQNAQQYKLLFEENPEPMLVFDRETLQYIAVNEAAIKHYGYSREEFLAMTVIDIRPSEEVPRVLEAIRQLRNGVKPSGVWQHQKKDGSLIDVEISASAIDFNGRPAELVSVEDITERKNAEAALRESEERYRDLVENAHDIIYSHDLEGNYLSVNRAGLLITGYSREESLSRNMAEILAPDYLQRAKEMIGKKLAGEEVTAYELEIIAKDGRRIAVEVNSKLMYENGAPVAVQGIARNVTERKHLEAQLRQSQKMEAIGQLAGGVAHDFNNLLTAINGYSALALQRIDGNSLVKPYLEEVKKAGDRAANLTRQLLAFGRKQILQPLPLDLNNIVSDMNKMLRRLIGEDITLTAKLAPDLKQIKADPGQIEQVLVNLVVNARDAMPTGGKLTIETANVRLDHEYASHHVGIRPGHYVMLAVSDTGIGMDEGTSARIFEPFFTTKEVGKGTGLGLSTVYGIVKQSGGNIWVYSEPNQGSSFKVYLPELQTEPMTGPEVEDDDDLVRGSETILLVEDEDVVRGLATSILEEAGYKVISASGGAEAAELCAGRSEPIDLLLTDVVMPQSSGKEVADQLTKIQPSLRVLFMSGYTDEAIVHHGVLDANVEFIQKPFTPVTLSKKVRDVLDRNGNASQS